MLKNEKIRKILFGFVFGLFIAWTVTFAGFAVQTYRLGNCLDENGHYREQLQCYQDREREIEASICRTEQAVSEGAGGLRGLRETLEMVEKEYVSMWCLLHNYDINTYSKDEDGAVKE